MAWIKDRLYGCDALTEVEVVTREVVIKEYWVKAKDDSFRMDISSFRIFETIEDYNDGISLGDKLKKR